MLCCAKGCLFDLSTDPTEHVDLAPHKARPRGHTVSHHGLIADSV
jgi:hypothetical protein